MWVFISFTLSKAYLHELSTLSFIKGILMIRSI